MLVDGIKARFNGRDMVVKIHREDLPFFEYRNESAFVIYKRIAAGEWTTSDIAKVLRFALSPRPDRSKPVDAYAAWESLRANLHRIGAVPAPPPDPIYAALTSRPIAQYAALAQLVLGAALFGIEEADATFTDEPDGEE
ncbi:hypothetical protein C7441_104138 [Pseudaminobacter salicylatoxidans]|uniref:Uncharacterized protein n=1 Tax=Pseudaminobacter salicylatoxidans TaxID=93369 RepID=A0A316C570_PSESE|nr:hypothetical protein [Pseudaminobacter salicylatoxidans]PWJ84870.1 hypothetical protein C7441_104138 [Pseudaminobacter salicylatoxidans]